jgi:hypothetical protein
MGSLERKARRLREREAWKAEPVQRVEPPPGVPARIWLDVVVEHGDLLERLSETDEAESGPLIAELTDVINGHMAEELTDSADTSDDANADRMEILLEKYAALLEYGESPERIEFERDFALVVEFAQGEGKSIFQKFQDEERRWRRKLPRA